MRESFVAIVLSLLLGVLVVGRPVWDAEFVYCATDTATCQAPWSLVRAPHNSELSDSGLAFYPHYRALAKRWTSGEVPLWNPDLYAGVPMLANPQWGALDPQVLGLVLLEALGGQRLFDMGLAWSAALRIALAAAGAYFLARRLGMARSGCALVGVGYSLSGSVVLWLGFSLSHVTPLLPWVLFGLEGLRDNERRGLAFFTAALALALAIYGGHPEVAFFVGLASGLWALVRLRREARARLLALGALATGVLLAAPMLLPFIEYLRHSGALIAHRLAPVERRMPDLLTCAVLVLFAGFVVSWRRRADHWGELASVRSKLSMTAVLGLGWFGLLTFLNRRGVELDPGLVSAQSIETSSARVPLPILAFAFCAWSAGGRGATSLRLLALLAAVALLLVLETPGVIDLWRWIPLAGLAAPARAACVAALLLSLLAGFALEKCVRVDRRVGVCAVLVLLLTLALRPSLPRLDGGSAGLSTSDEVVQFSPVSSAGVYESVIELRGRMHGGLEVDELRLSFDRLDVTAQVVEIAPFERRAELQSTTTPGVRAFDFGEINVRPLGVGDWRLRLEFHKRGAVVGVRFPALVHVPPASSFDVWGVAFAGIVLLFFLLPTSTACAWALVSLASAQGLYQARAWNTVVPRSQHYKLSETEAFLAERFSGERFFAASGILPADSALLAGLTTIDGYDAMDVASFDGYRAYALKPQRNPLLDWNAEGVALGSAAFKLFGVKALLFHSPRALQGWSLVAGPTAAERHAEVYVYAAQDPLPRAFCVPNVVRQRDVMADLSNFDPRTTAFVEEPLDFEIEAPFRQAQVTLIKHTAEELRYEVQLDGEGLFVATEQHFPGWRLEVNGEARSILRADSIFRGVFLNAGKHDLRFTYAPDSWRFGRWLGALGVVFFVAGTWRARSRRLTRATLQNP